MIVKKEKYYLKKINIIDKRSCYDTQKTKKTTYLLFGFIPVFISYKVVGGNFEK